MDNPNNVLKLSFSYKYGYIRTSKNIIETLGHPKFVYLTFSKENNILSICGTDERNINCLLVERHKESDGSECLKFCSLHFVKKLASYYDWNKGYKYVVIGKFNKMLRAVEFDLTTASIE